MKKEKTSGVFYSFLFLWSFFFLGFSQIRSFGCGWRLGGNLQEASSAAFHSL